jgi:magnesium transporter
MKPLETLFSNFIELHPDDAARAFESLAATDAQRLFERLPTPVAIHLFERLNPQIGGPILEQVGLARARAVVSGMGPRKGSAMLQQLNEARRQEILAGLEDAVARPLRTLARYDEETAGAIMEPRVASLPIDLTAQQAITVVRKMPREALYYLYVTQRDGTLIGVLNMRDLLLAAPRDPIRNFVHRDVVSVSDTTDREDVVTLMRERRFLAMPVVDFDGRLLGVVKHDEALEAGQLEAFEDLQKSVGAGADERALSPVSLVVRRRLVWLYVNLATAFLAAAVIGLYEGIIAQVAALAVLLPVVAGQGGNTGAQSMAVVMRGLALREIIPGARKRVVRKELLGGTINGVCVAVVTGAVVFAWRLVDGDSSEAGFGMSLVIGLAMIVNMAAAAGAGALIPLLLRALGRDPAQSASIFLTTVTDVVGFGAFLGFASLFLPMMT